jgi:1-deoxy-D-xylulose-5-phosphate synthase
MLLVTYGRTYGEAVAARRQMQQNGQYPALLKLNRIHPVEDDVISLMSAYDCVLFFEEVSRSGSVGEYVGAKLLQNGYRGHYAVRAIDTLLGACTTEQGLQTVGLDAAGIVRFVREQSDKLKADAVQEGDHDK